MKTTPARLLGLLALLIAPALAQAEQWVDDGEYRVHYSTIATMDLQPDVAAQFSVQRRRSKVLLVLTPQKLNAAETYSPVPASAQGTLKSLMGQNRPLNLRLTHENDVHYVMAEFEALNTEFLKFDIQVQPEGAPRPLRVSFQQQFFHH